METLVGFVTDLTGEKRGPNKRYRRFNLIQQNNTIINVWVFSSQQIENTASGKILIEAANKNLPVRIQGKITTEEGKNPVLKISINNKFDKTIDWTQAIIPKPEQLIQLSSSSSSSIRDVLASNTSSQIQAMVIDSFDEIHYMENENEKKYKMFIVADDTQATPIVIYDELIDLLTIKTTYIFTQIKPKKLHNNMILFASTMSTITRTESTFEPNLDNLSEIMSYNLTDREEVTTIFEEIMAVKVDPVCSICKQNLISVVDKDHLLKCSNCNRYSLKKDDDFNTNVNIFIDNQKQIFFTTKNLLQRLYKIKNPNDQLTAENLSDFFLTNGPWVITISHMKRQIVGIHD